MFWVSSFSLPHSLLRMAPVSVSAPPQYHYLNPSECGNEFLLSEILATWFLSASLVIHSIASVSTFNIQCTVFLLFFGGDYLMRMFDVVVNFVHFTVC